MVDRALGVEPHAYSHIQKDPRIRGGRACIDRTRIAVVDVVELLREGKEAEDMLHIFALPLTLSQVHSALAYYYDHNDEIERCFREDDEAEAQIERDRAPYDVIRGG
jgi:uncharacterized protein (DUF433 family)